MCYRGKCLHCIPVKPACLVLAILYAIFNGLLVVGCIYVWARILIEAGSAEVPSPNTVSVICGKNEEYYDCSGEFKPRRCSEIGYPLNYSQKCTPGCVCKGSYVRADNDTCIPIPDCPSCGGDKNAQQDCGLNCFPTCSNYNIKPPRACALYCRQEGCKCREGFVYDDNVEACVKPEDCGTEEKRVKRYVPDDTTYDSSSGWNGPSSYFVVPLVALLNFIFSSLLCYGICNLRPNHVKAFFWYGVVLNVVMAFYAVGLCFSDATAGLIWLAICVIHTLFLVLVHETHKVVEYSMDNGHDILHENRDINPLTA